MGECIFCLIAQGKIPSSKIYETDSLYAFLDLNPVHKGHTLIIPKKHAGNIFDLDPALGGELVSFMKKVGRAVMETTGEPQDSTFTRTTDAQQVRKLITCTGILFPALTATDSNCGPRASTIPWRK